MQLINFLLNNIIPKVTTLLTNIVQLIKPNDSQTVNQIQKTSSGMYFDSILVIQYTHIVNQLHLPFVFIQWCTEWQMDCHRDDHWVTVRMTTCPTWPWRVWMKPDPLPWPSPVLSKSKDTFIIYLLYLQSIYN